MRIAFLILSVVLINSSVWAQQAGFLQDINGRPVFESSATDVEGSPYLRQEWAAGSLKARKNRKDYGLAKARYDAHKDELEYDQAGKLYRFGADQVAEFTLMDGTFRSGFPALGSLTPQSFYQVLFDGQKVKLLKRIHMIIETEKPYNSATITQRYVKQETLYLFTNNTTLTRFKKDKKTLFEALPTQQAALEALIKDQKLKLSKEEDVMALLEKYEAML